MMKTTKKKSKRAARTTKELMVSFILDETGSMNHCKTATISGFNEYVDSLKKQPVKMTLTKFNSNKVEVVYAAKPIKDVPHLTQSTYSPDACTPLFDAVGRTVTELAAKAEHGRVLVVIQTDGQENASNEYTRQAIYDLIKQKEALGWTFAFLGAGKDSWEQGMQMGLSRGNVIPYDTLRPKKSFDKLIGASMQYCSSSGRQTAHFFRQ